MPKTFAPRQGKHRRCSFYRWCQPPRKTLAVIPPLQPGGNKPIQMDFEQQLKALLYFHLQEHRSGRHLPQDLSEDDFACKVIAPPHGIKKSAFFEAINHRGREEMLQVFQPLYAEAARTLPKKHAHWGERAAIDGSLIDAVLSMHWADCSTVKKAKAHFGFNLNPSIPARIFLADGKAGERPFVEPILAPGQTGVLDRGCPSHDDFDNWHDAGKFFVCRIMDKAQITVSSHNAVPPGGPVFQDAMVNLGDPAKNHTRNSCRLAGYQIGAKKYPRVTNRFDLPAGDIAAIYKPRWNIESFFAWWKRHLKVYHVIARTQYGLMAQILAGLIAYLLLAIYCHNEFKERVSIKRVRQLRNHIKNEARFDITAKPLKPDRLNDCCRCLRHAIS